MSFMMIVQALASDSISPLYLNNILEAISTSVSLPLSAILPSEAIFCQIISEMLPPDPRARIYESLKESPRTDTTLSRKIFSCLACRRRKLRRGREYPSCNRCRKARHESSCSYDDRSRLSRPIELTALVPQLPKQSTATPLALDY